MKKSLLLLYLLLFSGFIYSQVGIIFNKETFNFGYVLQSGGESKYRFNFQNKTQGIVQISKVYSDSEALQLNWTKTSIERQDKGFVEVTLKPENKPLGEFTEKIIVYTSANEAQPVVLTVMFNAVDVIPEPKVEQYSEYFGFLAADGAVQSKQYHVFIESLANYILKKGNVTLQIESSMSPMTAQEYSQSIAKKRAEDMQSKIIKSISSYELDTQSVVFAPSVILIQGPVYSKKTQGKEECSKFQYIKIIKK